MTTLSKVSRRAGQVLALALAVLMILPGLAHASAGVNISSASTQDLDANGHLDRVVVALTGDPGTVDVSQFVVDGYTVTGVTGSGTSRTLALQELPAYDTAAKPGVHFTDATGTSDFAGTTDGAPAVLVRAIGDDFGNASLFNSRGDTLSFFFSEPVTLFNQGTSVPAATAQQKHVALEQAIDIAGPGAACNTDGNGQPAPLSANNFPTVAVTGTTVGPDPIVQSFMGSDGTTVYSPVVTVTEFDGDSGSTTAPKGNFTIEPASLNPPCSAGITTTVANRNFKGADALAAINPGSGAPKVTQIRGLLSGAPTTGTSAAHLGQIDAVAVTFNHSIDQTSITSQILHRFTISDGSLTVPTGDLSLPASPATGATLTLNFKPPTGWNTGTTPTVAYDDSGTCNVDGVMVKTNGNLFSECAGAFSQTAVDKAAPALLGATTIDANSDGDLDGVRLSFSEPVKKDSVKFGGFTLTDATGTAMFTPSGISTPSGADDATVDVTFSPTGGTAGDTAATPRVSYSATSGGATDIAGNALADISNLQSIDGAAPVFMEGGVYDVMSGTTGGTSDGRVDEATFRFSEPVKDGSIVANKFHIGDAAASAFKPAPLNTGDPKVANDNTITMVVDAGVVGTQAKALSIDPGAVADNAASPIGAVAKTIDAAQIADHAAPVAMLVTPTGQGTNAATMSITFSEAMDTTQGLVVSYKDDTMADALTIPGDATDGHNNGWRTDAASAGTIWDGDVPAPSSGQCDAVQGCRYTISIANGKDAAGLGQAFSPDTRYAWTVDTVAPAAPVVSAPTANQVLTTTGTTRNVVVSGTATETGLTIQLVEGPTILHATTSSAAGHPWSITMPNAALGRHDISVVATDAGTNMSSAVTRTFWVKQPVSLTVAVSKGTVVYGQTTTITGVLKDAAGRAMAGKTVVIQGQRYGQTTWSNLRALTTNSSGVYSYIYTPSGSTRFRTSYAGTDTVTSALTGAVGTLVRVALSIHQSATQVALGQTMVITGGVRPSHAGKIMRLQQWTSTGWKTIATTALDASSNYRFNVRPGARGTYKYRIYYLQQDTDHIDNWTYATLKVV